MDKFLIELLQLNNSVILPDFGAIVIANENTGEVMFNEYLKFNDGKLIALIVANSTMDDQEATNMVAKYVRDIQIQLDKGDSYDIFGLGSFTKEEDGSTVFNGNIKPKDKSAPQEFMGPSPTPTKVENKVEKEEEAPTVPSDEKVDPVPPSIDVKESTSNEDKIIITETSESITTPEVPAQKVAKSPKTPPVKKKKKGVLFWLLIILLLLFSAGGITVGLKYEEVKTYMGWNEFESNDNNVLADVTEDPSEGSEETPMEEANEEDVMVEDSTETEATDESSSMENEEVIEDEMVVETTATASINANENPFHLIGGSFSSPENAEKFAKELQSKGLPAHVVGEFNGLHMVSAKSFATQRDAFAALKSIQEQAPGAWLFKYPK